MEDEDNPTTNSPTKQKPADDGYHIGDGFRTIWNIFRNTKEAVLALIILALFWAYPKVITLIDPAARSVDFSYIHMLIVRILGLTGSVLVVWVILHVAFPTLESYTSKQDTRVDKQFVDDWKSMSPAVRLLTFLGTIFFFLWILTK